MKTRLVLVTSVDSVAPGGAPYTPLVNSLLAIGASGVPVAMISNHEPPTWFEPMKAAGLSFLQERGRQNGDIISKIATHLNVSSHDILVLGASQEDIAMAKNGKAVFLASPTATTEKVRQLGIDIDTPEHLQQVVALSSAWNGAWWFKADTPHYGVRVLSDLSSKSSATTPSQSAFSERVTNTVKNGGPRLRALLTVTARSLLSSGLVNVPEQMWAVYPSSKSSNTDEDTLSDFTHRLRTTTSNVRFAKRGTPLFVRHAASVKRSTSNTARTDPANQVETLHLHPEYRHKVSGRNVFVIDDCLTYGLSFGVAAAFLRKAGAASVNGIALGKFGDQLHAFDIIIKSNPFAPVRSGQYTCASAARCTGTTKSDAQSTLRDILL